MEWYWALTILLGTTLGLMALGIPVAFAFFGANILGAYIFLGGEIGLAQVARNVVDAVVSFTLSPLIMFILMGEVLFRTGLAIKSIDAIERLFTKLPGRLSLASIGGGVVFSALSGSSMANTALLGGTLLPEMARRGYHTSMSIGPIMAVGGVAMLIPPSNVAVLLGSVSNIPISYLLLGGIVPGLMIGLAHACYVLIRCSVTPALAPAYDPPQMTFWEKVRPFVIYVIPLMTLFVLVVGSILGGYATPTESASLGAAGAIVIAAIYRCLTFAALQRAALETTKISAMMLFIIAGSTTFSQVLSFSGATRQLVLLVNAIDLDPIWIIAGMLVIVLILGMIMDSLSIILLTIPFFMPIAHALELDLVWFGILVLFAIEISGMTPPFGLLLFTMKSVAPPSTTTWQIYQAVFPFLLIELMLLVMVVSFPALVTTIPDFIRAR